MREWIQNEDGQGLVEYALLLGLIAAAVIIAMIFLREDLKDVFSDIANALRKGKVGD